MRWPARHRTATACAAWRGIVRHWRRYGGRRGTAAIEFALLFPLLVALMLGLTDASLAMITFRRVTVAAEEVALIATEASIQADNSMSLTPQQVYQAGTAIFGVMPGLVGLGASQPFSVTISVVVFTPAPAGCSGTACTSFTANVAWSVPLSSFVGASFVGSHPSQYLGSAVTRACGTLNQVSQSTTPTLTTIQTQGMTSLTSILVVDVSYNFTPPFSKLFGVSPTFWRTAILPPRLAPPAADTQYIAYDLTSTGRANSPESYGTICTGYL